MKVVDMCGAGLPALAAEFPTIGELVTHGGNGLVFNSPAQLADQLYDLLVCEEAPEEDAWVTVPPPGGMLERMRAHMAENPIGEWKGNWDRHALPVLRPFMA